MDPVVEFESRNGYLYARVLLPWTTNNAKKYVDETIDKASELGYTRIFADVSSWEQSDSEMTRFYTGKYIATRAAAKFRIAAFVNSESIPKFVENVAVNRGAIFYVFSDQELAVNWLLGKNS